MLIYSSIRTHISYYEATYSSTSCVCVYVCACVFVCVCACNPLKRWQKMTAEASRFLQYTDTNGGAAASLTLAATGQRLQPRVAMLVSRRSMLLYSRNIYTILRTHMVVRV
jgi:hypothetical protein